MKITTREFRQNLKKYLDLLEKGEVVEVRGISIAKVQVTSLAEEMKNAKEIIHMLEEPVHAPSVQTEGAKALERLEKRGLVGVIPIDEIIEDVQKYIDNPYACKKCGAIMNAGKCINKLCSNKRQQRKR